MRFKKALFGVVRHGVAAVLHVWTLVFFAWILLADLLHGLFSWVPARSALLTDPDVYLVFMVSCLVLTVVRSIVLRFHADPPLPADDPPISSREAFLLAVAVLGMLVLLGSTYDLMRSLSTESATSHEVQK